MTTETVGKTINLLTVHDITIENRHIDGGLKES